MELRFEVDLDMILAVQIHILGGGATISGYINRMYAYAQAECLDRGEFKNFSIFTIIPM